MQLATRWGLEHYLNGVPLEHLVRAQITWQAGWEYSSPPTVQLQPTRAR
jgi:hypothetical protein